MSDVSTVSIVVPVYNEERFVEPLLRRVVRAALRSDIIVVDDGSTDRTPQILARLGAELPIRIVRHTVNQGKGAAVRTGLSLVRGGLVLIQDADLEYDPQDYPALLQPLLQDRADAVYGSRFLGSSCSGSIWYHWGNWSMTQLVNRLFDASFTDVGTGYKAFRLEALHGLTLESAGFEVDAELTCRLVQSGRRILEVPITYRGRTYADGKKITWRDGLSALRAIIRCRYAYA